MFGIRQTWSVTQSPGTSLNLSRIEDHSISGLFMSIYLPSPMSFMLSYPGVMCLTPFSLMFIISVGLGQFGILEQSSKLGGL